MSTYTEFNDIKFGPFVLENESSQLEDSIILDNLNNFKDSLNNISDIKIEHINSQSIYHKTKKYAHTFNIIYKEKLDLKNLLVNRHRTSQKTSKKNSEENSDSETEPENEHSSETNEDDNNEDEKKNILTSNYILNNIDVKEEDILKNQSEIINKFKQELSNKLNIDTSKINVIVIEKGSIKVVYSIEELETDEIQKITSSLNTITLDEVNSFIKTTFTNNNTNTSNNPIISLFEDTKVIDKEKLKQMTITKYENKLSKLNDENANSSIIKQEKDKLTKNIKKLRTDDSEEDDNNNDNNNPNEPDNNNDSEEDDNNDNNDPNEPDNNNDEKTMEKLYELNCNADKNSIKAGECMERKVLEIINKSDFKLKKIIVKEHKKIETNELNNDGDPIIKKEDIYIDSKHSCKFKSSDHQKSIYNFYKYPFFSQYHTFYYYGGIGMDKIHVWEYNKKMFKFYVILQLIDTTFVDKGDEHLLFRPHMFVNDDDYGGYGSSKKGRQTGYLYLQDMETREILFNDNYDYNTHDGTFSRKTPQIEKLSPGNPHDHTKLNDIDRVVFCYFYETSGKKTNYMATKLGKIFIGVYILKGRNIKIYDNLSHHNYEKSCINMSISTNNDNKKIAGILKDRCKTKAQSV